MCPYFYAKNNYIKIKWIDENTAKEARNGPF